MIRHYLYSRIFYIIILMIVTMTFCTVLYLENAEISSVSYAFLLSFIFVMIIGWIDFFNYRKKYKNLKSMIKNFPFLDEMKISTYDEIQNLYDKIISLQIKHMKDISFAVENDKNEMTDFYTMWVHQIKTPIFALRLLLDKIPENSELLSELSKIENYSQMVLNYAKLNSENTELHIESHSLKELINETIKDFSGIFISKKIKLNTNISDENIITDKKWLKFALNQIISNAVKYTDAGEVSIETVENMIIISDTGIGISAEDLPRVFDKGFTGEIGRLHKNSTGLGLFLCKKSLNLLGYEIYITSEISKGTTVRIIIKQCDKNVS